MSGGRRGPHQAGGRSAPRSLPSYGWQDNYDEHSAVERGLSRLAGEYGFELPFIPWDRRRCGSA